MIVVADYKCQLFGHNPLYFLTYGQLSRRSSFDFDYGAHELGIRDDNGYGLAFGAPSTKG
jgi:hypothetical protein